MARQFMRNLNRPILTKRTLKVGDTVDSEILMSYSGTDPEDLPDTVTILQSDTSFNAIGKFRLYETFTRLSPKDAWVYMGLCEKGSVINRSPGEARRVFICSPFAKDPEWSIRFARAACYEAFTNGCLPIAPHLYFTRFLREYGDGYEREYGIAAGHEMMRGCDEIVVYAVDGYISSGMQSDIAFAINQLAMQPHIITMTGAEAEEYMKEYLENAETFQGLKPAEE